MIVKQVLGVSDKTKRFNYKEVGVGCYLFPYFILRSLLPFSNSNIFYNILFHVGLPPLLYLILQGRIIVSLCCYPITTLIYSFRPASFESVLKVRDIPLTSDHVLIPSHGMVVAMHTIYYAKLLVAIVAT